MRGRVRSLTAVALTSVVPAFSTIASSRLPDAGLADWAEAAAVGGRSGPGGCRLCGEQSQIFCCLGQKWQDHLAESSFPKAAGNFRTFYDSVRVKIVEFREFQGSTNLHRLP